MSSNEYTFTITSFGDTTNAYTGDQQVTTFSVNTFWQNVQEENLEQHEKPSEVFRELFGPKHGVHLPLDR